MYAFPDIVAAWREIWNLVWHREKLLNSANYL